MYKLAIVAKNVFSGNLHQIKCGFVGECSRPLKHSKSCSHNIHQTNVIIAFNSYLFSIPGEPFRLACIVPSFFLLGNHCFHFALVFDHVKECGWRCLCKKKYIYIIIHKLSAPLDLCYQDMQWPNMAQIIRTMQNMCKLYCAQSHLKFIWKSPWLLHVAVCDLAEHGASSCLLCARSLLFSAASEFLGVKCSKIEGTVPGFRTRLVRPVTANRLPTISL